MKSKFRLVSWHIQGCLGLIAALALVPVVWQGSALLYALLVRGPNYVIERRIKEK